MQRDLPLRGRVHGELLLTQLQLAGRGLGHRPCPLAGATSAFDGWKWVQSTLTDREPMVDTSVRACLANGGSLKMHAAARRYMQACTKH